MLSSPAVRQLQRLLITVLVILGTAVSLLLAHSLERVQPAELSRSAPVAQVSDAAAVDVDRDDLDQVTNSPHGPEAPHAYLGFACCVALLLMLIRLRKAHTTMSLAPRLRWFNRARRPDARPLSVTLISLCISRT